MQLVSDGSMRPIDARPLTRTRELEAMALLHVEKASRATRFASALKVRPEDLRDRATRDRTQSS
jgi:hypothetical protein